MPACGRHSTGLKNFKRKILVVQHFPQNIFNNELFPNYSILYSGKHWVLSYT